MGFAPSYYTSTVAARNAEQAKRARFMLVLTLVGATVLIVGVTVLLVWFRS